MLTPVRGPLRLAESEKFDCDAMLNSAALHVGVVASQ
jgi:hypothetical protein